MSKRTNGNFFVHGPLLGKTRVIGPWAQIRAAHPHHKDKHQVVAELGGWGQDQETVNADAQLFAAAPEMLEALSTLMQPELQIEATPGGYCIFRFTPEQVASARAAIKKAEGL